MVLINPFGGAGAAAAAYQNVRPILENAHINLTVKETERANHAYEIAHDLVPGEYDAIATISGDGLIFEVVNGLLKRADWQ